MTINVKTATTLVEALNVFDPRAPLAGETLKAFYVERPESPMQTMKVHLQALNKPGKFLFTGPRGSGKSTELHRLVEKLRLLEYTNANPWRDVHPIVLPLLEEPTP